MTEIQEPGPGGTRRERREPPPFHPVVVVAREELSPRLVRLTFAGPGLKSLRVDAPAASVRLLIPTAPAEALTLPRWNGNEFLLPDASRPVIRTFTPLRVDNEAGRLDLEIVRHPGGAVATWAETAAIGAVAAISGPARGFSPDPAASRFVVIGDETAIPAISQVLKALGDDASAEVHIEIESPEAVVALPRHRGAAVSWHARAAGAPPGQSLVDVVQAMEPLGAATQVFAAGEAAAMQAIRVHLFDHLGMSRSQTWIRGYWKAR